MFNTLPEAPSLAAANKRIGNILKKAGAGASGLRSGPAGRASRKRRSPREFAAARNAGRRSTMPRRTIPACCKTLAALTRPVDAFFDGVMVMTDDERLRDNRVALLAQLQRDA